MAIDLEKLQAQLDATIVSKAVDAAFQPIVDLRRGEIAGFETLTRLSEESDFRTPSELFDAAEKTNSLWSLEELTRRVSLAAAAQWPAGAKLFLNTTPQVFADPRFSSELLEAVRNTPGLTPGRVVLELTERSDHHNPSGLDEQVRLVKAAGFEIAIDDVGAGTSGLNRIMALRPHWLKLDRELIERIASDRVRQNLIRFFLRFATLSGVKLIAEGIEREDELATLMELGVTYGQGFLLGRPGSREQTLSTEIREFITRRRVGGPIGQQQDPRSNVVRRYTRPVTTVDSRKRVIEVAAQILREFHTSGVLVMDCGKPVGWCDRDSILRSAAEASSGQQMGFIVKPGVACASPETTIPDALELASARDERSVGLPLIVADETGVIGTVALGDLLHAAADLARDVQLRIAPLTGLPGRVLADEHLTKLLTRMQHPFHVSTARAAAHDVALLNISAFARYNEAMGYEMGDELLRRVVDLFRSVVSGDRPDLFFAHLGNDRFLATGPSGVLEPLLRSFLVEFDLREETAAAGRDVENVPRLHIFLATEATRWLSGPQMLYRMGEKWNRERAFTGTRSEIATVSDRSQVTQLRESA